MHLAPFPMRSSKYGREAAVYWILLGKKKERTDRALKLAEVGKPKSNWELQGLLGLTALYHVLYDEILHGYYTAICS
jgi:hypothetical protein